jgi:hypothetical protein
VKILASVTELAKKNTYKTLTINQVAIATNNSLFKVFFGILTLFYRVLSELYIDFSGQNLCMVFALSDS